MSTSLRCTLQRNGAVLVWLPILMLAPALNLGSAPAEVALRLGLVVTMVVACLVAVVTSNPVRPNKPSRLGRTPYVALGVLAAAVVVGSTQGEGWVSPWILLVITTPAVLRGWPSVAAVPVITAGAVTAAATIGDRGAALWTTAGGVFLAGVATTAFVRLTETVEELRRTRTELARVAVVEERDRFSRDLHDLLGHTLSVMVVKAEAVRRLAARDPDAAAEHARDIEEVGRQALLDVREAVDAMRAPTLADELLGARRALDAAGIRADISTYDGPIPPSVDEALAWVVREGVTNVLRHSSADRCRFELSSSGGDLRLSVWDNGIGGASVADGRVGGLDGLRSRVGAAGGRLDVEPGDGGFRLTARVPVHEGAREGTPR